jgi:U1 small nuclear ribonucleoprotein 70kDa
VDVERGRTVPNWRPRRLGGGLGSSRIASEEVARSVLYPLVNL